MIKSLLSFIGGSTKTLSQEELEAGLTLLLLTMYIDNHISESENKVLKRELATIEWQGPHNEDYFINNTISQISRIKECAAEVEKFICLQTEKLSSSNTAKSVLQNCRDMINSDGIQQEKEKEVLAMIKKNLQVLQ